MSLNIVIGKSRSGKSYYNVHHILSNYYDYSESSQEYKLKDKYKNLVIISNVDGLKLPHLDLLDCIDKSGGNHEYFFSKEYQKKIFDKYPQIIYFIDEAHEFFPPRLKSEPVYQWFSYHGHWGQDIYLTSQTEKNLPIRLVEQAEFIIKAHPQSKGFVGELKYDQIQNGIKLNAIPKVLKKDQKIFDLYKSHEQKSVEKHKNPMTKWIVLLTLVLLFTAYRAFHLFSGDDENKKTIPSPTFKQSNQNTIYTNLSYISQGNLIVVTLGNTSFLIDDFPYSIKLDIWKRMFCYVPINDYSNYFPTPPDSGADRSTQSDRAHYTR